MMVGEHDADSGRHILFQHGRRPSLGRKAHAGFVCRAAAGGWRPHQRFGGGEPYGQCVPPKRRVSQRTYDIDDNPRHHEWILGTASVWIMLPVIHASKPLAAFV